MPSLHTYFKHDVYSWGNGTQDNGVRCGLGVGKVGPDDVRMDPRAIEPATVAYTLKKT